MNKGIKISCLFIMLSMLFGISASVAQEKKVTKKITIIEETTNEDGSTTIKTTVKEGEDEKVLVNKKGEKHIIKKKKHKKRHGDDLFTIKKGGEVKIEIEVIEEDGEKKIIINREGDDEAMEIHEKEGNVFFLDKEVKGEFDVKVIEKDGEKIIIRGADGVHGETIDIIKGDKVEGNIFFIEKDGDIERDGEKIIIKKRKDGIHEDSGLTWFSNDDEGMKWVEKDASGAFIGIYLETNQDQDGILVKDVVENGPAEAAGIKSGDVITAIGDSKTDTDEALYAVLSDMEVGDEINISYVRDGKSNETKLKLADKAEFNSANQVIEIEEDLPFKLHMEDEEPKLGVYFTSDQGDEGLEIEDVIEGSVADKAGLLKGDIVYDFAGEKVEDVYDVLKMLKRVDAGETRVIKVKREGKKIDIKATF